MCQIILNCENTLHTIEVESKKIAEELLKDADFNYSANFDEWSSGFVGKNGIWKEVKVEIQGSNPITEAIKEFRRNL